MQNLISDLLDRQSFASPDKNLNLRVSARYKRVNPYFLNGVRVVTEVQSMSPDLTYKVVPLAEVPLDRSIPASEQLQRVVLVVDDEHIIADTLSIILKKSGFCVLTAYDAGSALELARGIAPDLLLSDVMMGPGLDGTQLAIEMTRSYPDCKVLLFSGHAATQDLLARARETGHDFALITKPVHPSDLLKRIGESLRSRGAARANGAPAKLAGHAR
jgi:CheY-like chemotaxis protein